jgi:hypothetical protein
MSMTKCASVGCHNTVARNGDRCSECKQNDLSYGMNGY